MKVKKSKVIDGYGLFSTQTYKKNDIIHKLVGEIKENPDKYTIEIGKNKHILDSFGIYINHSFTPNIKIENGFIVAIKDININEELCFNYNDNESNMFNPFYVNNILVSGNNNQS